MDGVAGSLYGVASNLPYVSENDYSLLAPEIVSYEPKLALTGGQDCLEIVRKLITQVASRRVRFLALELGEGQAETVKELCVEAGFQRVSINHDLAGIARVVVANHVD